MSIVKISSLFTKDFKCY